MTLKRLLGLVGVMAAVAVLASSVGAAPTPAKHTIRLSTTAAVKHYLRSLGISPKGVVIQRGARNYAGPRCPGKGWNCTKSRRVVQIATGRRAGATAERSFHTTGSTTNVATCVRLTGSSQSCVIVQTGGAGVSNKAVVGQAIGQVGQTLGATQTATVTQTSTNGSNSVLLDQAIGQASVTLAGSVNQSQTADQNFSISQTSSTGSQSIKAAQLSGQLETARFATSGTQFANGNLVGHVTQSSSGLSTATIKQVHNPTLSALGPNVEQTVIDPVRCCANQTGNANDTLTLTQSGTVKTTGDSTPDITSLFDAHCQSDGNCTATQTSNTNGIVNSVTSSGAIINSTYSCTGSECSQIVFDGSPGAGAPPATLGPYTMTPFGLDPQTIGVNVPGVSDPAGTIGFTPDLNHDRIGQGWATWSHGYTGDVYDTFDNGSEDPTQATITLPAGTKAFYFYAEPQQFALLQIQATAQDGTTSGPIDVQGFAGAQYFGFYGTGDCDALVDHRHDDRPDRLRGRRVRHQRRSGDPLRPARMLPRRAPRARRGGVRALRRSSGALSSGAARGRSGRRRRALPSASNDARACSSSASRAFEVPEAAERAGVRDPRLADVDRQLLLLHQLQRLGEAVLRVRRVALRGRHDRRRDQQRRAGVAILLRHAPRREGDELRAPRPARPAGRAPRPGSGRCRSRASRPSRALAGGLRAGACSAISSSPRVERVAREDPFVLDVKVGVAGALEPLQRLHRESARPPRRRCGTYLTNASRELARASSR